MDQYQSVNICTIFTSIENSLPNNFCEIYGNGYKYQKLSNKDLLQDTWEMTGTSHKQVEKREQAYLTITNVFICIFITSLIILIANSQHLI